MEPSSSYRHGNVVRTVFPHAITLFDYCSSVVNFTADQRLVQDRDSVSYKDLLHNTLVIPPNNGVRSDLKFNISRIETFPIRDMIGRLVSQCVRNNPTYQEQNCLALGYRNKTSNCDATLRTSTDTELYFVNTVQAIVTTQTWQLFANRVGEEVIRHIFSLSVFVQGGNMCYIQVSGVPASELVYKELKYQQETNLKKNATSSNQLIMACNRIRKIGIKKELIPIYNNISQNNHVNNNDKKNKNDYINLYCSECSKPINIIAVTKALPRYRIFYSSKYDKKIGLPSKHPLHKGVQKCNSMVDSIFLPALSLTEYTQSVSRRHALLEVFHTIRSAYQSCPTAALMENHCALSAVIKNAEPLLPAQLGEQQEEEGGDTSALFATPATPASMHICSSTGHSRHSSSGAGGGEDGQHSKKRQRRDSSADPPSSSALTASSSASANAAVSATASGSAGLTATSTAQSPCTSASITRTEGDDSTIHSTVPNTVLSTVLSTQQSTLPNTLTTSSSKEHKDHSNVLPNTPHSIMLTLTNTTHTHTTPTSLSINNTTIKTGDTSMHPNNTNNNTTTHTEIVENNPTRNKKHRRGCRAGKITKKQQNNIKNKPTISAIHTNENNKIEKGNNKNQRNNSLTYEIQKNIELLCKTYKERPLVTVGESIVNRIVESARRGQEYGSVYTQQSQSSAPRESGGRDADSSSLLLLLHPTDSSNSKSNSSDTMKNDLSVEEEVAAAVQITTAATTAGATAAATGGDAGLLGASEETTYASIPSVTHHHLPHSPLHNDGNCNSSSNSDRKRKYVSVHPLPTQQLQQPSSEHSTTSATAARKEVEDVNNLCYISMSLAAPADRDQEQALLQHSHGDFQYICDDSATPSTAPRSRNRNTGSLGRLGGSRSSQHLRFSADTFPRFADTTLSHAHPEEIHTTKAVSLSQLNMPPCPSTIGDIPLKAYKSNRRKKIKAKFRSLFRDQLMKLPLLQQHQLQQQQQQYKRGKLEESSLLPIDDSMVISPILPNSMDSGLKYHLNRPYLTEANYSSLKRKYGDPRSELFPSQEDRLVGIGLGIGSVESGSAGIEIVSGLESGLGLGLQSKQQQNKKKRMERLEEIIKNSDLLSLNTPTTAVATFIKSVCMKVFPYKSIWGSRHNHNTFLAAVEGYIYLGRHESFQLKHITTGMRLADIPWLNNHTPVCGSSNAEASKRQVENETSIVVDVDIVHNSQYTQCSSDSSMETENSTQTETSTGDEAKPEEAAATNKAMSPLLPSSRLSAAAVLAREQLFFRFIDWVFSDFINPLLSSSFYVTEVEGRGTEVYYYRKPVWAGIIQRGKQQLFSNFVPLVCTEESHIAAATAIPPVSSPLAKPSTTAAVPLKENTLQRAATAPASCSHNPDPPPPQLHRTGSLLFNEILRTNQQTAPSLAEQNIAIISHLPSVRTSISASTAHNNTKLKRFLERLPLVRFVPKKNSVRAITNLRTKRNHISSTTTGIQSYSNTFNTTNTTAATATTGQVYGEVLTNTSLYNCLHVLKSVYSNRPQLAGFGAFGLDDIYLKFLKYKQHLATIKPELFNANTTINNNITNTHNINAPTTAPQEPPAHSPSPTQPQNIPSTPKFFIAVLDLEKCYDNVDPQRLYSLLKNILSSKEDSSAINPTTTTTTATSSSASNMNKTSKSLTTDNVIHKYSVTHPIKSMDRNISKNIRCVTSNGEIVPFKEAAAEIAESYPYSIITDAVVYPKITNQEVLRLLRIHLFQHAVKIPSSSGPSMQNHTSDAISSSKNQKSSSIQCKPERSFDYYTQIKGIPQGSVLSPLLCTFYYGHAETTLFHSTDTIELIGLVDKTLIIRLMDDYIIVSIDQHCVEKFLQVAHEGLKQYGAGINHLKTKTNFYTTIQINGEIIKLNQINNQYIPWCGLLINTENLEISCNFERILDRPIINSLLIEYIQAGKGLKRVIKTFMRMKCHAIVLDMSINMKQTVIKTLYTMYLIVAIRTITYIKQLQQYTAKQMNVKYVYKCIAEGIQFGARLIHTRTIKKSTRKLQLGSNTSNNNNELNKEFKNNHHINNNEFSTTNTTASAVDLSLFASCIENIDPDHFGCCDVSYWEACWLGATAFIRALECHRAQYCPLIRGLQCLRSSYSSHCLTSLPGGPAASAGTLQECEDILKSCQWG